MPLNRLLIGRKEFVKVINSSPIYSIFILGVVQGRWKHTMQEFYSKSSAKKADDVVDKFVFVFLIFQFRSAMTLYGDILSQKLCQRFPCSCGNWTSNFTTEVSPEKLCYRKSSKCFQFLQS